MQWFWRPAEIPSRSLSAHVKKNGKLDPREVFMNVNKSVDAEIDVETIMGHCKVHIILMLWRVLNEYINKFVSLHFGTFLKKFKWYSLIFIET